MRAATAVAALCAAALAMPAGAGAWGGTTLLTASDGADYRAPAAAQNAAGDAVVAWVRSPAGAPAGSGRVVLAPRLRGSARWGGRRVVSGVGVGAPSVAVNPRGDAVVAWPLRDQVQVATRTGRTGRWQTRTIARAGGPVSDVVAAVGSGGVMSVLWSERRGSAYRVRMAERRAGRADWAIRGLSAGARSRPVLAVTPRRGGAAIWVEGGRVRTAYNPAGIFRPTVQLDDADGEAPAAVAMSPAGGAIAAWGASLPGGTVVLSAAERRSGGGWRTLGDVGLGSRPAVAMNGGGDALVAWPVADDDGRAGVDGVARRAGGDWEPVTIVRRSACGCTYTVGSVAVDGAGAMYVAWSRAEGRTSPVSAVATREAGAGAWRSTTIASPVDAAPRLAAGAGRGAVAVWAADGRGGGVRVRSAARGA